MIDIGIDEGGSGEAFVVSAIIGQTSRLEKLDREWKAVLKWYGVDYFHGKEHWNHRAKPYNGISMRKRKKMLTELVRLIHKYAYAGRTVWVDEQKYKSMTSDRFRSNWGSSYAFAIQLLVLIIYAELLERGQEHESANILIEEGHPNARQIDEIISKGYGNADRFLNIRTHGFGGKRNNPILQAADCLAYSSCQQVASGESKMMRILSDAAPQTFKLLECNEEIVGTIRGSIEANLQRIRELRSKK